jgi:pyruvate carboxylase subunit B
MSQMVGTQAVSNVLFGRYKMVSEQVKDYLYGLYGAPPARPDPELTRTILKGYDRGQEPITANPSDLLDPELDAAGEAVRDISSDIEDVLTYALYPTTGMRFLRIKHGLDPVPDEMKPPAPDGVSDEARPVDGPAGTPVEEHPERSANTRRFNVFVGDEYFEVDVDPVDPLRPTVTGPQAAASRPRTARSPDTLSPGEHAVSAPMPGVLLRYEVEAGQAVEEGDPIAVLEAMKMENTLPSPAAGTVRALLSEPGATVKREAVLAIISP